VTPRLGKATHTVKEDDCRPATEAEVVKLEAVESATAES